MRVKSTFIKEKDGRIFVRLSVVERGDYPSLHVFPFPFHPHKGEEKVYCKDSVSTTVENTHAATTWVNEQVKVLSQNLNKWRKISTPPSKEYEI